MELEILTSLQKFLYIESFSVNFKEVRLGNFSRTNLDFFYYMDYFEPVFIILDYLRLV